MTLPQEFFEYTKRAYGMDHDRYEWSMLPTRPKVEWPGGARVALWITVSLEWFPLDCKRHPIHPPGEFAFPYPDMRSYTLRDFGNRVGVYRVMKALDRHGIPATAAINAGVAARYPSLVKACVDKGWEAAGHGMDMGRPHFGGLDQEEEARRVNQSLAILREVSGQPVRGWLSPAKSQSWNTLDLVAAAGVDYVCDWGNDDMPYEMKTESGPILGMPHPLLIDDWAILIEGRHSEDEFSRQLCDQFDALYAESARFGGRVMSIALRPWVIGQPFRIGALEKALAHIMSHRGVWAATGSQIADSFRAQAKAHVPARQAAA